MTTTPRADGTVTNDGRDPPAAPKEPHSKPPTVRGFSHVGDYFVRRSRGAESGTRRWSRAVRGSTALHSRRLPRSVALMGERDPFLVALVLAPALLAVEIAAHEVVHAAINVAVTGSVADCGLGPWTYRAGRVVTCYSSAGIGEWNDLLTPLLMAAAGILTMHYSSGVSRTGVRWALLAAGAGVTLYESLYAAAIWGTPLVRPSGVVYHGDGIDAVEAFGPEAMLPGIALFAVGFWVLVGRVTEAER